MTLAGVQSLNNLHTAANLPYTEFAAGQAAAEQAAWANVQTDFNSTVTSINGESSAYDNHVAGQITGLTSNAAGAQATYIATVAPAIETWDTDVLPVSVCKVFLGICSRVSGFSFLGAAMAKQNQRTSRRLSDYAREVPIVQARKKAVAKARDPERRRKIAEAKRGKKRPKYVIKACH